MCLYTALNGGWLARAWVGGGAWARVGARCARGIHILGAGRRAFRRGGLITRAK